MVAALSIINRSAEIIGYKDPDEVLSGNDADNFLGVLNSMVDGWATDSLFVYAKTTLAATVSGNPVTIGPGQAVDTPRPLRIPEGGFFRSGSTDYGFQMVGYEQYQAWITKTTSSPWPLYCFYEAGLPTGRLYFYPALASSGELHLPVEQRLTEFADLATDYTLAPGVKVALEYSLAEELAPGRRPLDVNTARLAMKYRRGIENFTAPLLDTGFERVQGNILAGWR